MRALLRRLIRWALRSQISYVRQDPRPADPQPKAELPFPGFIAVPTVLVRKRTQQIVELLEQAGIPSDVATIAALRRIHDQTVRHNAETGWILDATPQGKVS